MNTRINYKWNDNAEIDSIVTDGVYDFGDWLLDNGVNYEHDGNTYYVIDELNEKTGESYTVVNIESTDEELRG